MLDRLVPMLREIRTPLAVGYAYLFVGWLIIYNSVPSETNAIEEGTASDSLYQLWRLTQGAGLIVVVSFVAYLVGTLTAALWSQALQRPDDIILSDRAQREFAEADLRIQLAPPIAAASLLAAFRFGSTVWLFGLVPVVLLSVHGYLLRRGAWMVPARRDLNSADLAGRDLRGANLRYADLGNADIRNADLSSTSRHTTDFRDLTLASVKADGVSLNGTLLDIPAAEHLSRAKIMLGLANLNYGVLTGADLTGADLTDADLTDADLRGTTLRGATLTRADLRRADLTNANLSDAQLDSVKLGRAKLNYAKLNGARLVSADLDSADLTSADLTSADLTSAKLSSATLNNTKLMGADLTNVDLSFAKLYDTNMTSATLDNTKLDGVDLTKANLTGVDRRPGVANPYDRIGEAAFGRPKRKS